MLPGRAGSNAREGAGSRGDAGSTEGCPSGAPACGAGAVPQLQEQVDGLCAQGAATTDAPAAGIEWFCRIVGRAAGQQAMPHACRNAPATPAAGIPAQASKRHSSEVVNRRIALLIVA